MSKVYFIGDTHFGHHNLVEKYDSARNVFRTIEEHDRALVERWNAVVKKHDTVWHLGDVAMWDDAALAPVAALNGQKKLILGNHDFFKPEDYIAAGFAEVHPVGVEKYGFWLCHIPVHPQQIRRWGYNVHAHCHEYPVDDPAYLCVSAEQTDYTPIELGAVRSILDRRKSVGPLWGVIR